MKVFHSFKLRQFNFNQNITFQVLQEGKSWFLKYELSAKNMLFLIMLFMSMGT